MAILCNTSPIAPPIFFFDLEYDHTGIRGPNGSRRMDYSNSKSNLLLALSGISLFKQFFNSEFEEFFLNKTRQVHNLFQDLWNKRIYED